MQKKKNLPKQKLRHLPENDNSYRDSPTQTSYVPFGHTRALLKFQNWWCTKEKW